MTEMFLGMIGGFVPTLVMVFFYFVSIEKRISKIETNIYWLKRKSE